MLSKNTIQRTGFRMKEFITLRHGLPYFSVTKESVVVKGAKGAGNLVTEGITTSPVLPVCPCCGGKAYSHGTFTRRLWDLPVLGRRHLLIVTGKRYRCTSCHHMWRQRIGFASPEHNFTFRLGKRMQTRINLGGTLTDVSRDFGIHPYVLYRMDRKYLQEKYGSYSPGRTKLIGIDEFLLHEGHRYATIVTDLERGDVIFVEEGKKKQQAEDFFRFVGPEWMRNVEAVSMDMNAQYDSAFREHYPHIAIVYDYFHLIKLFNDSVLTRIRRRLQREARENGDMERYKVLKGGRFILLSSREKLRQRDEAAHANNSELFENYEKKGLSLPPGRRKMFARRCTRLRDMLALNSDLNVAYFLLEQLKVAYEVGSEKTMKKGFRLWLRLAGQSSCHEILAFRQTVIDHLQGILSHARYSINSGKVEGTNNMVKTIKKQAYGFRDSQYFFMKILIASRLPAYKYKSNRLL